MWAPLGLSPHTYIYIHTRARERASKIEAQRHAYSDSHSNAYNIQREHAWKRNTERRWLKQKRLIGRNNISRYTLDCDRLLTSTEICVWQSHTKNIHNTHTHTYTRTRYTFDIRSSVWCFFLCLSVFFFSLDVFFFFFVLHIQTYICMCHSLVCARLDTEQQQQKIIYLCPYMQTKFIFMNSSEENVNIYTNTYLEIGLTVLY